MEEHNVSTHMNAPQAQKARVDSQTSISESTTVRQGYWCTDMQRADHKLTI